MASRLGKRIFLIPDTQVAPGVPTDHFDWIGEAIRDYEPDYIVHLGDHWDMASLSHWSGQLEQEGRRYTADIEAGNAALERLHKAMGGFRPRAKYILRGNHEDRIRRAVEENPKLRGALTCDHFNDRALGWIPVDYCGLDPGQITIEGVLFAHYFTPSGSSRPIGGNAGYKLAKIGRQFAMGHVQGLSIGDHEFATGDVIRGVVAGSCYLHDESYRGNANKHSRCIVVLNEVIPGQTMSVMDVSLTKLCHKYTGTTLARYMQRRYRNAKQRFSVARAA